MNTPEKIEVINRTLGTKFAQGWESRAVADPALVHELIDVLYHLLPSITRAPQRDPD